MYQELCPHFYGTVIDIQRFQAAGINMILKDEIGKERNESAVLNDIAYLKRVSDLEDRAYLYRLSRKLLIEQLAVAHVALSENEFF